MAQANVKQITLTCTHTHTHTHPHNSARPSESATLPYPTLGSNILCERNGTFTTRLTSSAKTQIPESHKNATQYRTVEKRFIENSIAVAKQMLYSYLTETNKIG